MGIANYAFMLDPCRTMPFDSLCLCAVLRSTHRRLFFYLRQLTVLLSMLLTLLICCAALDTLFFIFNTLYRRLFLFFSTEWRERYGSLHRRYKTATWWKSCKVSLLITNERRRSCMHELVICEETTRTRTATHI
jgi:hypothetical protein